MNSNPKDLQHEQPPDMSKLWKTFGMESAAGKSLYKLYAPHTKPSISYPKPKTRPMTLPAPPPPKPCPQKAVVEYPPVTTKASLLRAKLSKKFTKLDMIPKRKRFEDIRAELDELQKARAQAPIVKGGDRDMMKRGLQDKMKYAFDQRGTKEEIEEEEQKIKEQALLRMGRNKPMFIQSEINKRMGVQEKEPEKKKEEKEELNELFDLVVEEIKERQEYLEKLGDIPEGKQMRERIKNEIVERVSELQKITELIRRPPQKD